MATVTTISLIHANVNFSIDVVCHGGADISDFWEFTDKHIDGVTINNVGSDFNSYNYAVPKQTTLAQLTSEYSSQGRVNPSKEAYDSLQEELRRDNNADYFGFLVYAEMAGIQIMDGFTPAFGFAWSCYDDKTLQESAISYFKEHCIHDVCEEIKSNVKTIISKFDILKTFAGE